MITPVEKMGRNELCWCHSGLKYKKCHLDREKQIPLNLFEAEGKINAAFREGYCSYPDPISDPCSSAIIKSHTIQKRGGIAAIAENGHVHTVKPRMKNLVETKGNPAPRKISVNDASVFPGFCNKHDTSLFKPIEGKVLALDKNAAFLLSYRAVAYQRFAKEVEFKITSVQRESDRGHPFNMQSSIQKILCHYIVGVERGRRDLNRWKAWFDTRLVSGARDDFHFVAVRFDRILPFVASAAFHPEFGFDGTPLQRLGRDGDDLDHVVLNVTTFDGQTIAVFGWIGDDTGPAKIYSDTFLAIADDRKADALLRALFIQTDNVFLRPSWWDGLPQSDQAVFKRLMLSGSPSIPLLSTQYTGSTKSTVTAGIAETVRS